MQGATAVRARRPRLPAGGGGTVRRSRAALGAARKGDAGRVPNSTAMEIRDLVLYGLAATHARLLRCLEDLSDDEAHRTPHGLSPIVWQAGHIALTDAAMARRADGRTEPPAGYESLFATGTGGPAAYPPLAQVRDAINRGQGRLEEIARTADPAARVEARNYSTVGEMLMFAVYHRGYHIGKITTLRALLGKPRLFG